MSEPYTRASAQDLRTRFPNFSEARNADVERALTFAEKFVSDDWVSQVDFTEGMLLYAAHHLTLDGFGATTEAELIASGTAGFDSVRSGSLTLSGRRAQNAMGQLGETQYGRRYYQLARRNRPGPIAAS